ncbi:maleylacetoacetate isomerase [Paroceanicella profunda]|uniref:Maleylacetoacetate isomerase n=1 Tax=Paroceanicella profunda TaxID=2579971 RepID=A0A5B8FZ66_9RHOB|nr:maleylacetoacetate isomerase [Paroceanicella profunda]QDL92009.1 maleylacetoacetate isomerase [Paroceanicella profunda]
MTVLYDYWRSSAAYRVRIALNLAGIAYESVPVNLLTGAHRAPEHLARNPQGLVPALEIDGRTLTQSLAIIEYLDETRGTGFLPQDPAARAQVRATAYAIAMEIHPVCNLRVSRLVTQRSGGAMSVQDWMEAFLPAGLKDVEALIAGDGQFCHGDHLSLADICLVPQVFNARRYGIDLSALPRIGAVMERLEALEPVAAAHPDRVGPPPEA